MAIVSGGEIVLADTTPTFARTTYWTPEGVGLTGKFASYSAIYRQQLWVFVVAQKLALGTARLPFKVYRRTADGREDARETPFAALIRRPNPKHDPYFFWLWTASTFFVFGEALWVKIRGRDGGVRELWPLHPVNVFTRNEDGVLTYFFYGGASTVPQFAIPAGDVVHFKAYNPDTTVRGMSPIEPLRQTLLNEDAARRATASFWQRGARPAVALSHPGVLSQAAADRLRAKWDAVAAGTDNTGSTVVLEEGMKPEILQLNMEEAQYINTRKLNREEVCGAYDVPPPVVHILDHATYSNITEQMRSMYRDTMAPRLALFESVVDTQLRPDFDSSGDLYGEFLMDEVLRGDFEVRAEAYQKAINSGWMMPAEVRALENMPAVDGSDRLFINATLIPIDEASQHTSPNPPAENEPATSPEPAAPMVAPQPAANQPVPVANGAGPKSFDDDNWWDGFQAGIGWQRKGAWPETPTPPPTVNVTNHFDEGAFKMAVALPDPPEVHVEPPDVHVDCPVTVNVPKASTKRVERDAAGNVVRLVEED